MHGHGPRNDRYRTPEWFFKLLNDRFSFTLDAAATVDNKKCMAFCRDGLKDSWEGERVFCNPPWSKKKLWMKKAHEEVASGRCPVVVMLLPSNSMSSSFWFDYVFDKYHHEVINKRLFYIDPETGEEAKQADSGTTVVYFMKRLPSKKQDTLTSEIGE